MPRLFTALEIPRDAALSLSLLRGGLPGARWIDVENYHMTLRFIGDVEGHVADEIANALDRVRRPAFSLTLCRRRRLRLQEAAFGLCRRQPSPDLNALQGEIDRICQRLGIPADPRKFTPHVTLARLRNSSPARRRDISVGARQFLDRAVPGRALRADVVARFGRRRPLCHRGSLAAGRRRPARLASVLRRCSVELDRPVETPFRLRLGCANCPAEQEFVMAREKLDGWRRWTRRWPSWKDGALPATAFRSVVPSPSRISARPSPS